jgi:dTDP-4-amino-4,6-dideoxygalactose transaminase
LKSNDHVLIVKSTDGPYISGCITQTIEKVCRWSQTPHADTKLILVIHEFGFPCPQEKILFYKRRGIPILEDCAYAIGSKLEGSSIGTYGDFALYSLSKHYPLPSGGILISKKKISAMAKRTIVSTKLKEFYRTIIRKSFASQRDWNRARKENWTFFAKELRTSGIQPYFPLKTKIVPEVFLMKVSPSFVGEEVKKRLANAGIESTQYYNQSGFYFPNHQFLTPWEKSYIVKIFLNKTI